MLQKLCFLLLASCCLVVVCSCKTSTATTQTDIPQANLITVKEVDKASMGNMRIALLSKLRTSNLVVVNKSNQIYLKARNPEVVGQQASLQDLDYQSSYFNFHDNTAVVIVEDEIMGALAGLLEKCRFYEYAEPCSEEDLKNSTWPPRDAIFVEKDRQMYALIREEKMLDPSLKSKVTTYRTVKTNVLLAAQRCGHTPVQVQQQKQ